MPEAKNTDWLRWKHAMLGYAEAYSVRVPEHFHVGSDSCGKGCRTMLSRIQQHVGLKQTGQLGDMTKPYVAPFLVPQGFRAKALDICREAIANAGAWHYHQWRPYQRHWAPGETFNGDCSGSTEMIDLMAGAADPSGFGYNGQGNTTSIAAHSHRIPAKWARPGDMVLWVSEPTAHVCILLKPGPDPLLFSMGSEAGPYAIRLSVEDPYHAGAPIFLQAVAR